MKIAVNTRFLLKDKLEGIGVFTFETLKILVQTHKEHQFYFIFDRPWDEKFIFSENIIPVKISPPARHPLLWFIWFEFSLRKLLKKIRPDLLLSPDGFIPLNLDIKSVSVIHDIAFEHYPKDIPFLVLKYYKFFFPRFASKATRIAVVSDYTSRDIQSAYKTESRKIDVVYNGVSNGFHPVSEMEKNEVRQKLTDGSEYFVYVGALHPRKNIGNLLQAYDLYRKNANTALKLVIIGRMAWKTSDLQQVYEKMEFKNDVIFTGRIPTDTMTGYLAAARALTYISYFEGFGLPVIEAFSCEVPAIVANSSSLPEVAGDGALLVDPFNISEIAAKMDLIAGNDQIHQKLIENAKIIRQKYTWKKTASLLWNSVLKAINEN